MYSPTTCFNMTTQLAAQETDKASSYKVHVKDNQILRAGEFQFTGYVETEAGLDS